MPLETINFIEDFIETNPVGATDPKSEGDDHIRGIKRGILANLPNLGQEAVRMSASQFNAFTGMIAAFPALIAEGAATGWLKCNGQAVLRDDYPELFALLGDLYGIGDGVDNFILPDYRGEFLRGQDEARGLDPDAALRVDADEVVIGDVIGSRQWSENKSHSHGVSDPGHGHGAGGAEENGNLGGTFVRCSRAADITLQVTAGVTGISIVADGGSIESRPVNINVQYFIHV